MRGKEVYGLRDIRVAPLDKDGNLASPFTECAVVAETPYWPDFDEEAEAPIRLMAGLELVFELKSLDPRLLVLLGVACRCCYGLLKKRRCRACVARP